MSDHLDRLFRNLVTNLAALDPGSLRRAFAASDIHTRLVPYRTHRTSIGFDSGEDYEMAVLRLLSGERGYAAVQPDDAREAFAREVQARNPDTALFKQFPEATVLLDAGKVAEVLGEGTPPGHVPEEPPPATVAESPEPTEAPTDEVAPPEAEPVEEVDDSLPFLLEEESEPAMVARPREVAAVLAPCPYCGDSLPVGRTVLFCPHCGQNVGVVHCPICGSELDAGWRFCITCGEKVTGLG